MEENRSPLSREQQEVSVFQIHLAPFEGPLDLLLHLIDKNKMDIYDIPIHEITKQYLAYVEKIDSYSLSFATDFLYMAAHLLYVKSRLLLPKVKKEEEEWDPRTDLVLQLLAYKRCKYLAQILMDKAQNERFCLFKEESEAKSIDVPVPPLIEKPLSKIKWDKAVRNLQLRNHARFYDLHPRITKLLQRERRPMYLCIQEIWRKINEKKYLYFTELLGKHTDRVEEVSAFLAILELMRMNQIDVKQNDNFSSIQITKKKEIPNKQIETFLEKLQKQDQEGGYYG